MMSSTNCSPLVFKLSPVAFNAAHCGSWWLLGSSVTTPLSSLYPFTTGCLSYGFQPCDSPTDLLPDSTETVWFSATHKNPWPAEFTDSMFATCSTLDLDTLDWQVISCCNSTTGYILGHSVTSQQAYNFRIVVPDSFKLRVYSSIERQLRCSIARHHSLHSYARRPYLSLVDIVHSTPFTHDITYWDIQFPVDYSLAPYVQFTSFPSWVIGISSSCSTSDVLPLKKLLYYHFYRCGIPSRHEHPLIHATLLGHQGVFVCFAPSTHAPLKFHTFGLKYNRISGTLFLTINSNTHLLLATDLFLWNSTFYPYFATIYPTLSNVPPPTVIASYSPKVVSLKSRCRSVIRKLVHRTYTLPAALFTNVTPVLKDLLATPDPDLHHIGQLPLPQRLKEYLSNPLAPF